MTPSLRLSLVALAAGITDTHPAALAANISTLAAAVLELSPEPAAEPSPDADAGNVDLVGGAVIASLASDVTSSASAPAPADASAPGAEVIYLASATAESVVATELAGPKAWSAELHAIASNLVMADSPWAGRLIALATEIEAA